jgi:hypothetical protein
MHLQPNVASFNKAPWSVGVVRVLVAVQADLAGVATLVKVNLIIIG